MCGNTDTLASIFILNAGSVVYRLPETSRKSSVSGSCNLHSMYSLCCVFQGPGLKEAAWAAGVRAWDAEDQPAPVRFLQPHLRAGGWEHHRYHGRAWDDPRPGGHGWWGPSNGTAGWDPWCMSTHSSRNYGTVIHFSWTKISPPLFFPLCLPQHPLFFKKRKGKVFTPKTWAQVSKMCCRRQDNCYLKIFHKVWFETLPNRFIVSLTLNKQCFEWGNAGFSEGKGVCHWSCTVSTGICDFPF